MRPWIWMTLSVVLSVTGIAWAQSIAWRFPGETDRQLWISHPTDMIGAMAAVLTGVACLWIAQKRERDENKDHIQVHLLRHKNGSGEDAEA